MKCPASLVSTRPDNHRATPGTRSSTRRAGGAVVEQGEAPPRESVDGRASRTKLARPLRCVPGRALITAAGTQTIPRLRHRGVKPRVLTAAAPLAARRQPATASDGGARDAMAWPTSRDMEQAQIQNGKDISVTADISRSGCLRVDSAIGPDAEGRRSRLEACRSSCGTGTAPYDQISPDAVEHIKIAVVRHCPVYFDHHRAGHGRGPPCPDKPGVAGWSMAQPRTGIRGGSGRRPLPGCCSQRRAPEDRLSPSTNRG
jgi:hypothetical protein